MANWLYVFLGVSAPWSNLCDQHKAIKHYFWLGRPPFIRGILFKFLEERKLRESRSNYVLLLHTIIRLLLGAAISKEGRTVWKGDWQWSSKDGCSPLLVAFSWPEYNSKRVELFKQKVLLRQGKMRDYLTISRSTHFPAESMESLKQLFHKLALENSLFQVDNVSLLLIFSLFSFLAFNEIHPSYLCSPTEFLINSYPS